MIIMRVVGDEERLLFTISGFAGCALDISSVTEKRSYPEYRRESPNKGCPSDGLLGMDLLNQCFVGLGKEDVGMICECVAPFWKPSERMVMVSSQLFGWIGNLLLDFFFEHPAHFRFRVGFERGNPYIFSSQRI